MSAWEAAVAGFGAMVDDSDVSAGFGADLGDVADKGAHILRRVFVAAGQRAIKGIDDDEVGVDRGCGGDDL